MNQVSYHEADHEADKEPHFTPGEQNYDRTLAQAQINLD